MCNIFINDMGYSEYYKKEEQKMNLAKKYKQLFEGKTRSNDSKLVKELGPGQLQSNPFDEPEGKDPHHEELVSLVRELDPNEYEVFAFDANIDPEDATEMMNWIYSLTDSEAKSFVRQLKGM